METINDIINEIREIAHNISIADEKTLSMFRPVAAFARIADRLDAAYKRDMQSMVEAGEIDMRTAMDEVTRLRAENARLKAALKPVISAEWPTGLEGYVDQELVGAVMAMCNAVFEAKKIYNGGAK